MGGWGWASPSPTPHPGCTLDPRPSRWLETWTCWEGGCGNQDPCELGMAGGTDCAMGDTGATAAGEQGRGVRTKAPPGVRAWAQPPCPSCSAHGHRSSRGAHLGCACPPGPSSPDPQVLQGGWAVPPFGDQVSFSQQHPHNRVRPLPAPSHPPQGFRLVWVILVFNSAPSALLKQKESINAAS